jgi:hypothetical protein
MSLIKNQSMTDKNLAAHRQNGRQSRGAATAQGKERSRAANLRHGFYSREREEALGALGEDPAQLAALREATHNQWQPANDFQARAADRLAGLWWRMERADRIQESLAAGQMQEFQQRRQDKALRMRYQGVPQMDILELLMNGAADPRFYAASGYFEIFFQAFGKKVDGTKKDILDLMHRLRKPEGGVLPTGVVAQASVLAPDPDSQVPSPEAADPYLEGQAEMDDADFPIPRSPFPVAVGAEREELREELHGMARHELELTRAAMNPEFEEQERPLTRIERDQVQAMPHRHAELMRREEERCFRQFMRLGTFLIKIQDRAEKRAENEGAPGYVDENTERGKTEEMTNCSESAAEAAPQVVGNAESEVDAGSEPGTAASGARNPGSAVEEVESEAWSPGSEVEKDMPGVEKVGPGVVSGRPGEAARQAGQVGSSS